jgi:hypothetical protein
MVGSKKRRELCDGRRATGEVLIRELLAERRMASHSGKH